MSVRLLGPALIQLIASAMGGASMPLMVLLVSVFIWSQAGQDVRDETRFLLGNDCFGYFSVLDRLTFVVDRTTAFLEQPIGLGDAILGPRLMRPVEIVVDRTHLDGVPILRRGGNEDIL